MKVVRTPFTPLTRLLLLWQHRKRHRVDQHRRFDLLCPLNYEFLPCLRQHKEWDRHDHIVKGRGAGGCG